MQRLQDKAEHLNFFFCWEQFTYEMFKVSWLSSPGTPPRPNSLSESLFKSASKSAQDQQVLGGVRWRTESVPRSPRQSILLRRSGCHYTGACTRWRMRHPLSAPSPSLPLFFFLFFSFLSRSPIITTYVTFCSFRSSAVSPIQRVAREIARGAREEAIPSEFQLGHSKLLYVH